MLQGIQSKNCWHYLHLLVALTRTDKPYGTMLLFWPCLWALLVAGKGVPSLENLIVFALGAGVMRACGCVINDIADQDFDSKVARTAQRPLAAKKISTTEAVVVFVVLSLIALALTAFLTWQATGLAALGFCLACLYPFAKRWMAVPQLVLGVAFSWGVLVAFMQQQGFLSIEAWLMYAAVVVWTVGYDTIYAMQDKEDDKKIGIGSAAIAFGRYVHQAVGILYAVFAVLMACLGWCGGYGWGYAVAWAGSICVLGGQIILLRKKTQVAYGRAFRSNQIIGAVIALALWGS